MERINLKVDIGNILKEYGQDIEEVVEEAVEETAKHTVKRLKGKKTFAIKSRAKGNYAKGWKADIEKSRLKTSAIIHNAKFPGRVHLLEHGHLTRNGIREYPEHPAAAYPHVEPALKQAEEELAEIIERKVRG